MFSRKWSHAAGDNRTASTVDQHFEFVTLAAECHQKEKELWVPLTSVLEPREKDVDKLVSFSLNW